MQNVHQLLAPTKVVRSKRKNISLIIDINGDFIVRAPIQCSEKRIYHFIFEKAEWVIKKRKAVADNLGIKPLKLQDGETITIIGEELTIRLTNVKFTKKDGNFLYVPPVNAKESVVRFVKRTLKGYLDVRVREIANSLGFEYQSISISSARTNWGSCSFSNKLHFSYKLALCPKEIIDYVVIHELCHIKVKNHSAQFWNLVKGVLPNYKQHEKWLKENRAIINII